MTKVLQSFTATDTPWKPTSSTMFREVSRAIPMSRFICFMAFMPAVTTMRNAFYLTVMAISALPPLGAPKIRLLRS